jgi:hypothetical protein
MLARASESDDPRELKLAFALVKLAVSQLDPELPADLAREIVRFWDALQVESPVTAFRGCRSTPESLPNAANCDISRHSGLYA